MERAVYRFAANWAGNFAAVLLVALVLDPHVRLPPAGSGDYWATAAAFAAVLALLNTYLRPLLYLVLFPVTCLVMVTTLGLAHFLVGALMYWLAGQFVGPIFVESFGWALLGALITAVVATIVSSALLGRDRKGAKGGVTSGR